MNNRTLRVLGIIVLILVAAYAVARISAARRTGKYLADLATTEPDKVMDALAGLRDRGPAVGPALAGIVRQGQAEAAPRAAWLLGMIGSHAGDSDLLAALQSKDQVLRLAAMEALGHLKSTAAVQPISSILGNKEEKNEARVGAAYALAEIGDPSTVTALAAPLADHPAPAPEPPPAGAAPAAPAPAPEPDETIPVRIACARALGNLRAPQGGEALAKAVSAAEPDPEVRVAAAYALGDVAAAAEDDTQATTAINGLLDGLKDKIGDVRIACAYALGRTSPPEAMKLSVKSAVDKAREDDHYWTRLAARETAEMLRLPE